jgi:hypothetical protein
VSPTKPKKLKTKLVSEQGREERRRQYGKDEKTTDKTVDRTDGENTGMEAETHKDGHDETESDRLQNPARRKKLKTNGGPRKPRGRPTSVPRIAPRVIYDWTYDLDSDGEPVHNISD